LGKPIVNDQKKSTGNEAILETDDRRLTVISDKRDEEVEKSIGLIPV